MHIWATATFERDPARARVLEVEPDHLVLLLGKQQIHDVDGVLHPDRVVGVCYLLSMRWFSLEEERVMQQSSVSISLSF